MDSTADFERLVRLCKTTQKDVLEDPRFIQKLFNNKPIRKLGLTGKQAVEFLTRYAKETPNLNWIFF